MNMEDMLKVLKTKYNLKIKYFLAIFYFMN